MKTTPVLFLLDKSLAKQGPATAETLEFLNKFVNISSLSFLTDKPLVSKSNGVFEFEELSSLEIQFIPFEFTPKTMTSYFFLILLGPWFYVCLGSVQQELREGTS